VNTDDDLDWITVNGAAVPLDESGSLGGEVGEKIESESNESGGGGKTYEAEKQEKIDSIDIDFEGDSILPNLNSETLEEFGIEDKPVLLKQGIIEKNMQNHPEVDRSEYKEIIGNALYKPDAVLSGGLNSQSYNFISKTGENKNAITLLQVENTNSDYLEIVNFFRISDKAVENKERRANK